MNGKQSARSWRDLWERDEEVGKACMRYEMYEEPARFSYTRSASVLQVGPQCGPVALAMCLSALGGDEDVTSVDAIVSEARRLGYTYNGEMFSAEDMCSLARAHLPSWVHVQLCDSMSSMLHPELSDFLFAGSLALVPYDSDANHSPCLKQGHKAHWALVCGAIESQGGDIHVLTRHGKSRHLAVWNLEQLARSNAQLLQFAPHRTLSDLNYRLPEGGICGPHGLNNKCILIHNHQTL